MMRLNHRPVQTVHDLDRALCPRVHQVEKDLEELKAALAAAREQIRMLAAMLGLKVLRD